VRLSLPILLLLSFCHPSLAQCGTGSDSQVWGDFTTRYHISPRWQYIGDQGIRKGGNGISDFTLLYVRPSVHYQVLPELSIKGGIRFFKTFLDNDGGVIEIGPWQGIKFLWPTIGEGNYVISHYLRLEERLIWVDRHTNDHDLFLRGRYQLGLSSPTYDILFTNGIFVSGSIEYFWDIHENSTDIPLNQIRFDIGAGTHISLAWRAELHYLWQGQNIDSDVPLADRENILRLRFIYTFN
jgi:hypothetical protein